MVRDDFYGVTEQAKAGKHRLDDARALMGSSRWRGAMYLAGYAVECLLKTKLMQKFGCRNLRELDRELARRGVRSASVTVFTHQLAVLLRLTGATDRLQQNQEALRSFSLVNQWLPAWRYTADLSNAKDAQDFLTAVEKVLHWIEYNS